MIDAYLDREVSAEEAKAFESHLAACVACRERHGPLVELLDSPEGPSVPDGLRDRIVAAVADSNAIQGRPRRAGQQHRWRWVPRVAALAAAVGLFLLGWAVSGLWNPGTTPADGSHAAPEARSVVVVVTPWALSCWAQSVATGVPVNPLVWAAQATAMDAATSQTLATAPVVRMTRRATTRQVPEDGGLPAPEAQFLQTIPRLLGV